MEFRYVFGACLLFVTAFILSMLTVYQPNAASSIARRKELHEFEYVRSNLAFISLLKKSGKLKRDYVREKQFMYRDTTIPVRYDDIDGPAVHKGRCGRITVRFDGRLGSNLYQYCMLYAAAIRYRMEIVLPADCVMAKVFKLNATLVARARPGRRWAPFIEYQDNDPRFKHLDSSRNIEMIGLFRSLRYWSDVKSQFLEQLHFHDDIENKANAFIRKVGTKAYAPLFACVRAYVNRCVRVRV